MVQTLWLTVGKTKTTKTCSLHAMATPTKLGEPSKPSLKFIKINKLTRVTVHSKEHHVYHY